MTVPKNLRQSVGKTKLKQSLGTDSLAIANELKWGVLKTLKDEMRDFERQVWRQAKVNSYASSTKSPEGLTGRRRRKVCSLNTLADWKLFGMK